MREFDELNTLSIDEYFDGMEIGAEEKERRKGFAMEFNETMLFIFLLISTMEEHGGVEKSFITSRLREEYRRIASGYGGVDGYVSDYIEKISEEIVSTTLENINEKYYTSGERAFVVSVNEANSILGYRQFQDAVKDGYTKKTWITERDNRVRKAHREVDGETIDISEPFLVGDSLMMYAHDGVSFNASAEELVNCRCATIYLK